MSRRLEDWVAAYQRYTRDTESAAIFHKWVAFSAIAGALQKKVWFNFGRIKIYPNLFIVFVAEPGIARKTQAINYGEEVIAEVPAIIRSADAITPQALLEDLELARAEEQLPDGTFIEHNSLYVISVEFESFLGQKGDNQKMIILLTDTFDCKYRPYRYRTKAAGTNVISSVFVNLLAATTPDSLANCISAKAIGGGLTTRIFFVWADAKSKKIDVPELTEEVASLKIALTSDLDVINRIAGGYDYTKSSRAWWADWYNNFDERDPMRICKDPAFRGWYSRKPMFVIKLGMIIAASKRNTLTVTPEDFEEALEHIGEVEKEMANSFVGVGKSEIASEVALVGKIISQERIIDEKQLLLRIWRDVDANKFDNVASTLLKTGSVTRVYKRVIDGKQVSGVWYKWIGA